MASTHGIIPSRARGGRGDSRPDRSQRSTSQRGTSQHGTPQHGTPQHGVSRRDFLKLSIALGGAAAATGLAPRAAAAAETAPAYPERFTFAVMSDIHYFSPSLYGDNADYTEAENSDRKMFRESASILDAALAQVVAAKPDMVIVPGDLTKDGERICHEEVEERFAAARDELAAAGVNTQFYVINGNHDLNNHHGKDFSGGSAADAERTDPLTYKQLWQACGYTDTTVYDADGTQDGSLSYVARPCPGLTLIAVDTCTYNVDAGDGTLAQETGGHISSELLTWVCDQARKARAAGDVVLVFQHHGIVPHFDYEPVIFSEYLVTDYEAVAKAYAEAGVSAVLTGHMHANDIASATYGDATIYDIETGSLVTYPSRMRMGSIEFTQAGDTLTAELTVDSHALGTIDIDSCGLDTSADIEAYGKERTLTVDSVTTMIGGMLVEPLLAQVEASGGIKPTLAGLLGCEPDALADTAWGAITSLLPGTIEEGIEISVLTLHVRIFYNAETNQIEAWNYTGTASDQALAANLTASERAAAQDAIANEPATLAGDTLYLHIEPAAFADFLDALCTEVDNKALLGDASAGTIAVVNMLVQLLLTASLGEDTEHTVLGLVDYAYQDHLLGCETQQAWAEDAIAAMQPSDGSVDLLSSIVGTCVNTALDDPTLVALAESITFDLKTLIATDNVMGMLALNMIASKAKNVAGLLDLLTGTLGMDLGGTVAGLVPSIELFGETVPSLAANALRTLSHDSNVSEDHDFTLEARATIPEQDDGEGGAGGDGGSGTGGAGGNEGDGGAGGSTGDGGSGNTGDGAGDGTGTKKPSNTSDDPLVQTGDFAPLITALAGIAGTGLLALGTRLRRSATSDLTHDDEA